MSRSEGFFNLAIFVMLLLVIAALSMPLLGQ